MRLVIGLGNPGEEYRWTRHNIGFITLDRFLIQHRKRATDKVHGALTTHFKFAGQERYFAKPQQFMNRSGPSVTACVRDLEVEPHDVLVLHDDADLDVGRVKLKKGGGSGGHKGLDSIIQSWGEAGFYRLRIGIGRGAAPGLTDYVLEPTDPEELRDMAEEAAAALELVIRVGPIQAMNQINRRADLSEEGDVEAADEDSEA